ncbi:hypothetical protein [Saccharomonospora glauca]|jgi:hypothetical protein|uniref:hypothetical protein n=1 Tax=Saccharomonospora glauca TaxID=40990 RepID=UPI0005950974|nr:hypothetical protein [Saccharomonospora glauca]
MSSSTGSEFAADGGDEEHECVFHTDTPPLHPSEVPSEPRERARNGRGSVLLLVVWACASLLACLLGGLLSFVEIMNACDGVATLRFGSAVEVRCHAAGSHTDTPVNAVAAVVLFSGFGLVVTLLLATWHGIARKRRPAR